jgi:hypothetical protein
MTEVEGMMRPSEFAHVMDGLTNFIKDRLRPSTTKNTVTRLKLHRFDRNLADRG